MEFNEKLQALRKEKGLTQEQLAQALFVSRTAISKWESGRGYPGIDSLKALADFFSVTVDQLLSGEEILTAAREERKNQTMRLQDLVFGLLDLSVLLLLFLPFFGQGAGCEVMAVSLPGLTTASGYVLGGYYALVLLSAVTGILLLVLQNFSGRLWQKHKRKLSVCCSLAGVLMFTLSRQPYAAAFLLLFLTVKALMLLKKP